jgi:hypothetical protein
MKIGKEMKLKEAIEVDRHIAKKKIDLGSLVKKLE